ncbi:MAG: DUF881 domain-containing protein [bacterium]
MVGTLWYTVCAVRAIRPQIQGWQVTLTLFLLLVGYLLVVQFRAGTEIRREAELPTVRVRDLAVLVNQQEEALQALQGEVEQLRARLQEYKTAAAEGRSAAETLSNDADSYRLVLGLTPVQGPGVLVRLKEGIPTSGGVVGGQLQAQAQDLSGLVNELWSAGAEAIAINGVRILATTGIKQDERGISAGNLRLEGPYLIRAIGNPNLLTAVLNLRGGFVEGLRSVGLSVEVAGVDSQALPPSAGQLRFRYASPVRR